MSYPDEEKREEYMEYVAAGCGCLYVILLATAIIAGFYIICTL